MDKYINGGFKHSSAANIRQPSYQKWERDNKIKKENMLLIEKVQGIISG